MTIASTHDADGNPTYDAGRRYPFPWSIEPIEPTDPDRTCDLCGDRPATKTGLLYQQTQVDPAEWEDACDECAT